MKQNYYKAGKCEFTSLSCNESYFSGSPICITCKESRSNKQQPGNPSHEHLMDIKKVAEKYCFITNDNIPSISIAGIMAIIDEWERMKPGTK